MLNLQDEEQISPHDLLELKAIGYVRYSQFDAKGDGKTDDMEAIAATHAFANRHGLSVKADKDATYYIGGSERSAIIQTNTNFGTAAFIIDDTKVQNFRASVFLIDSSQQSFPLKGVDSLKRNQTKIDVSLPGTCLISVSNSEVRQYIRSGLNQTNGSPKTDIFIVDKNGMVDPNTPILWDFEKITTITALPVDETVLTVSGGRFTTIANKDKSEYNYYARGIIIKRSNVLIDGLEHHITGEGEQGAPYRGFIIVKDCSHVSIRNTTLTGHKTYETIGSAGAPVAMGSYDFSATRALNVSLVNCTQTNDIDDVRYWGIMGSNYSKNLAYDNCTLSRFDAHKGVANATIRNSTLGHMGINAIGSGTLTVENSTIRGRTLINLRSDYGSTWNGNLIIRNCVFIPSKSGGKSPFIIGGDNTGQHDFGYTCYMPERITIEGLHIDDSNYAADSCGTAVFANFNPEMIDRSYQQSFPYVVTKELSIKDLSIASGKELRISDNPFMFKDVKLKMDR